MTHAPDTTATPTSPEIVHMWQAPMPSAEPDAGYPVLADAVHTTIWAPTREQGAYNHHPRLAIRDGQFHAIFSNHPHGEDGPGQRVLYTTSPDGRHWSEPAELIPPPGEVRPSEQCGLVCTAFDWRCSGDRMFALVGLNASIGFTDPDGLAIVAERDAVHFQRARHGYTCLTREVLVDGGFGPIMRFDGELPDELRIDADPLPADLAADLQSTPCRVPPWDFEGWLAFPHAADGHQLCEPTVYRTRDGARRMLLRDKVYSHRMFLSEYDETTSTWPSARPTDIPDSPSLTDTVELADGTVLLIGNQTATDFDNYDRGHYKRDPLTVAVSSDGGYHFDRVYALRSGAQAYRTPQSVVKGRGPGAQYPCAQVHDGHLYVIHSMGKEDIAISSVALTALGL